MPTAHRGLRVALLGPVLVEGRDGVLVEPPGILAKALLAALVGPEGNGVERTHGVESIADEIWGDDLPRNQRQALQTLVSRLRSTSAEGLVASRAGGYALAVAREATDIGLAHELGRQAAAFDEAGEHEAAIGCLDEALSLWRGEPGLDLGDSPTGAALREAATVLRVALREQRAASLLDAGHPEAALAELEPLAASSPFDERLQHTRLRALAAAGRRTEAIAAFAALRSALRDELGISPGPSLVALNAELLRADDGGASAPPPATGGDPAERPVVPSPRTRIGLRAAPNPLIGRDDDVRHLESLLAEHRLVTVLGTGGLGKTRLAQEVAGRSDAPVVVVVELASIRSDDDVPLALASALGVRETTSATAGARLGDLGRRPELRERIIDQLGDRAALLVVDNCEHVVEGAATWIADLLAAVPRLTVLATSRSPLEIGAERVYRLDPLDARSAGEAVGPAVRLFLDRASAARPGASLPLEPIARLCERLDGLPLAIELAAARIRSMSVEQIEARLGDRFALLAGGDRSAPERQRTLLAVIEWSWALLTPEEQDALPRLAWFVDGFPLDAAEAVLGEASDALAILEGLIAQSLLSVVEDPTGRPRYRMLETVREFGQSRLDDGGREAALTAVQEWTLAFARARREDLRGPGQISGLARTAVEQDNLVAVLRRAIDRRDSRTVLELFTALGYLWTVRGAHTEIVAFSGAVLDATRGYRPTDDDAIAATLAYVLIAGTNLVAFSMTGLRGLARLRAVVRPGLRLPDWVRSLAEFLVAVPDLAEAGRRMDEMVASPDPETALIGNILRTQFAENSGDAEEGLRAARRAHELARQVGDAWAAAMSAMLIAELATQTGDAVESLHWAYRARDAMVAIGAEEDVRQLEWTIAGALLATGRADEAGEALVRLAALEPNSPEELELTMVAEFGLAEVARVQGRNEEALERARSAVGGYARPQLRGSPWFLMTLAGLVAGGVQSGWPEADLARWAGQLRRRTVALLRARPRFSDRPVIGTSAAGWAAWAAGHPHLADRACELFALAESLRSRQDLPALDRDAIAATIVARVGADRLDAARRRVAAMTADEQRERARAVLAEPVPAA